MDAAIVEWMNREFLRAQDANKGEVLTIHRGDFQRPVTNVSSHWQLTLFPEARLERSKTYASNDSVEMFCAWMPALPTVTEALTTGPRDELCFPFSYPEFLAQWKITQTATGLARAMPKMMVPYEGRHSGPSIDAALGTRTRKERQERGRWASDKSQARYERRARLMQSFNRLPAALQAHGQLCEAKVNDLFLGRISADELVVPATLARTHARNVAFTLLTCTVARGGGATTATTGFWRDGLRNSARHRIRSYQN